jgi:hypothetical protein
VRAPRPENSASLARSICAYATSGRSRARRRARPRAARRRETQLGAFVRGGVERAAGRVLDARELGAGRPARGAGGVGVGGVRLVTDLRCSGWGLRGIPGWMVGGGMLRGGPCYIHEVWRDVHGHWHTHPAGRYRVRGLRAIVHLIPFDRKSHRGGARGGARKHRRRRRRRKA